MRKWKTTIILLVEDKDKCRSLIYTEIKFDVVIFTFT